MVGKSGFHQNFQGTVFLKKFSNKEGGGQRGKEGEGEEEGEENLHVLLVIFF
jgi:hypothetical protein